eukprot:g2078.t1
MGNSNASASDTEGESSTEFTYSRNADGSLGLTPERRRNSRKKERRRRSGGGLLCCRDESLEADGNGYTSSATDQIDGRASPFDDFFDKEDLELNGSGRVRGRKGRRRLRNRLANSPSADRIDGNGSSHANIKNGIFHSEQNDVQSDVEEVVEWSSPAPGNVSSSSVSTGTSSGKNGHSSSRSDMDKVEVNRMKSRGEEEVKGNGINFVELQKDLLNGEKIVKFLWNPPRDVGKQIDYREGMLSLAHGRQCKWLGKRTYTSTYTAGGMKTTKLTMRGKWLQKGKTLELNFDETTETYTEDGTVAGPPKYESHSAHADKNWKTLKWIIDISAKKSEGGLGERLAI